MILLLAGCAGTPKADPTAIDVTVRRIEERGCLCYEVGVRVMREGRTVNSPRLMVLPLQEAGMSVTSPGVDPNGIPVPFWEGLKINLSCSDCADGKVYLWIRAVERGAGRAVWTVVQSLEIPEGIPTRLRR